MKPPAANPVDHYVGIRIRKRREQLGLSGEWLAAACEIGPAQLENFERGRDRIGSATLFTISKQLDVPFGYFLEGYRAVEARANLPEELARLPAPLAYALSLEGLEFCRTLAAIEDPATRKRLLAVVRLFAEERLGPTPPVSPRGTL